MSPTPIDPGPRPGPAFGAGPPEPPRGSALRRAATPLGSLAGVAAAWAYVATVNPNHPGHYPVCPFLYLTGWYCPACGGLRSAYAVAHGQFGAAVHDNVLAVVGYGVAAVLWVLWLSREVRGRPQRIRVPRAVWWGLGAVVLIFTVVRNTPFGAALAP